MSSRIPSRLARIHELRERKERGNGEEEGEEKGNRMSEGGRRKAETSNDTGVEKWRERARWREREGFHLS